MKGLMMKTYRIEELVNGLCVIQYRSEVTGSWRIETVFHTLRLAKEYIDKEIQREKGRKVLKIHNYPLDNTTD